MKIIRAKLKIVRMLICALLLCSFPSVKVFAEDTFVNYCYVNYYINGVLYSDYSGDQEEIWFDGSSYSFSTTTGLSSMYYSLTAVSVNPSVVFSYSFPYDDDQLLEVVFGSNFDSSVTYTVDLYFDYNPNPTPTPIPTRCPTDTPTPTPWIDVTYGDSGSIYFYLRAFNGNYRFNDDWFQPSSDSLKIAIRFAYLGSFTGDIPLPFPYKLDLAKYPVNCNTACEGYGNRGVGGSFSSGNEDGTVLHVNNLSWPNNYQGGNNLYLATITMTPSPTLSPTPTLTPYPSAAPAAFSTYTISFVAPNGYVVGTIRPMLSVGSSYSGAISALVFSFLDGWFSYGDEVNGVKGSFTWDYSFVENFGDYQWFFRTDSWPESESINIPVYRLDGEYPEVVPDLNNVSDLFDTIGKTDPQNFSWFYDGLQAFIDINWSWAYLMLLFPLFVMLWAFFRRH